jgi:hypothetical protein
MANQKHMMRYVRSAGRWLCVRPGCSAAANGEWFNLKCPTIAETNSDDFYSQKYVDELPSPE